MSLSLLTITPFDIGIASSFTGGVGTIGFIISKATVWLGKNIIKISDQHLEKPLIRTAAKLSGYALMGLGAAAGTISTFVVGFSIALTVSSIGLILFFESTPLGLLAITVGAVAGVLIAGGMFYSLIQSAKISSEKTNSEKFIPNSHCLNLEPQVECGKLA